MKAVLTVLAGVSLLGAGGCGPLDNLNDGLSYANEAAGYVTEVKTLAEEAPALAEQAVTDADAKKELETQLESIQKAAAEFDKLTPPDAAADIHDTITQQNEKLQESAAELLSMTEEGKITVEKLEETELVQSAQQISGVMNQIEKLGE
ncbi:DUF6376 family protein [Bacillus atrophaeus]|uniref:DUF6376 family protein n=1 Tax=Bacillus atrophaeus TaxID=1452 RepID=UPI000B925B93|nr:DUF6376 family protein [Bacillus atrophaeus]ASS73272.1 hypothetical protein BaGK_21180 [Bacillus atrophaeus]